MTYLRFLRLRGHWYAALPADQQRAANLPGIHRAIDRLIRAIVARH